MRFEVPERIRPLRARVPIEERIYPQGDPARVAIGLIKVVGAQMLHHAIDRAIQFVGAKGVSGDTPLERMDRHARFACIYDGPDEVHRVGVARLILRACRTGEGWDFGG